jgi:membrane protein DedA with SNARE-associated domain
MRVSQRPIPKRPFRDTAIFYAALSVIFVLVVWATGGAVLPRWEDQREIGGLTIAILFFVVATSYSWWRFRQRMRLEEEREPS